VRKQHRILDPDKEKKQKEEMKEKEKKELQDELKTDFFENEKTILKEKLEGELEKLEVKKKERLKELRDDAKSLIQELIDNGWALEFTDAKLKDMSDVAVDQALKKHQGVISEVSMQGVISEVSMQQFMIEWRDFKDKIIVMDPDKEKKLKEELKVKLNEKRAEEVLKMTPQQKRDEFKQRCEYLNSIKSMYNKIKKKHESARRNKKPLKTPWRRTGRRRGSMRWTSGTHPCCSRSS